MANLMHKLIRNQSCLKAIPRLTSSLINHHKSCINNVVESLPPVESDLAPLANPVLTIPGTKPDKSLRFYPSFPIGYGYNPTLIHDSVEEEETVIYADSVKKKRKKKMNKHKYRKLRKRLGRKS